MEREIATERIESGHGQRTRDRRGAMRMKTRVYVIDLKSREKDGKDEGSQEDNRENC